MCRRTATTTPWAAAQSSVKSTFTACCLSKKERTTGRLLNGNTLRSEHWSDPDGTLAARLSCVSLVQHGGPVGDKGHGYVSVVPLRHGDEETLTIGSDIEKGADR